jgi:hypothetical protein
MHQCNPEQVIPNEQFADLLHPVKRCKPTQLGNLLLCDVRRSLAGAACKNTTQQAHHAKAACCGTPHTLVMAAPKGCASRRMQRKLQHRNTHALINASLQPFANCRQHLNPTPTPPGVS